MKIYLFYFLIAAAVVYGLSYFNAHGWPEWSGVKTTLPAPYKVASGKVLVEVLEYGNGPVSRTGASLIIKYEAKDDRGRIFAKADEKEPLTVTLGSSDVIPGLEAGLRGMQTGERRRLTIDSEMAYGTAGNSRLSIFPNTDVVYEITLLRIR